jgi:hypothetical protein
LTFDGETAMQFRRLELVNLRHPLIRAAVARLESSAIPSRPVVDLHITADAIPGLKGTFAFGIFLLSVSGAQSQSRLMAVAVDEEGRRTKELEDRLLWAIQDASTDAPRSPWSANERDAVIARMTTIAASIADQVEAEARDRNDAVLAVRQATIERTIKGKIAKRRSQIQNTTNERIQRMWNAEIRNLELELDRRLEQLESRRAVGVSYGLIGAGRITVASTPPVAVPTIPAEPIAREEPSAIDGYAEPPPRELPWS